MTETTEIRRTNGHAENDVIGSEPWFAPNVDIFENEEEILLAADFPGVPEESLAVSLDGTTLTLEGRRPGFEGLIDASRLRRTFTVPDTIDAGGVEAELRSGVLRVRLPKREDAKPRRVPIEARD